MRSRSAGSHIFFGIVLAVFLSFCIGVPPVFANTKQAKLYKRVFGADKPRCIHCHADSRPKKADGEHDLNEYGRRLIAINEDPDKTTYEAVGPGEPDTSEGGDEGADEEPAE